MLNWADFAIIAMVTASVVIGFFRGFFRETVSLASWILAFWLAIRFAQDLDIYLQAWITTASVRLASSYILIFLSVLISGGILNYLIKRLVKHSEFAGTDRMLGMAFGSLRGAFIVVSLILLLTLTPAPNDVWWQESLLIEKSLPYAHWLHDLLPQDIARHFEFEPVDSEHTDQPNSNHENTMPQNKTKPVNAGPGQEKV